MTTTHDPRDHQWRDAEGVLIDEEDRGLRYDLSRLTRRGLIGMTGVLGVAALAGCAAPAALSTATTTATSTGTSAAGSSSAATTTAASASSTQLTEVPDETAGPYPADGKGGKGGASINTLDDAGIVRSDITSSFGASTTKAQGVPLTVKLTLKDTATSKALAGAAVYLWHANRDGQYSLYSSGVTGENYLRGVQVAGAEGTVTFTTIYPGCYDGRWPHIHFEVYASEADAVGGGAIRKTSQIALPESTSREAYAVAGYEASVSNLSRTSLATDMVFRDDRAAHQLATMSGTAASGFTAALIVGL